MSDPSDRALPCLGSGLGYSAMASESRSRPIRIAGCSGSSSDRRSAMARLAANHATDPIDVIIGDWMSEANMTARAAAKSLAGVPAFERTFLEAFEPAVEDLARYGIKLAVNAGASDTAMLHEAVVKIVQDRKLSLKVAWISGDEVLAAVGKAQQNGESHFENVCTGEQLSDWPFKPIYAQAYLGGLGIAAAFARGADIVICGRVSDASPVIGAAAWWHGWMRDDLDQLANAFVAGHLIECSTYVCGGNFTGFKSLEDRGWDDIGYPIAEIDVDGQVIITKSLGSGGEVSTQTCTSQLLYEIQGPWYFNSDVTAILTDVWFDSLGTDRVALRGVKGDLPPPTTKVGITAQGGYQAEAHWFLCGLDIEYKARMLETQVRKALTLYANRYTTLNFTLNGSPRPDAANQNAATVDFRIFVQAPTAADLAPSRFIRPVTDLIMQGYPGATFDLDLRQGMPKPYYEYYVTLLSQEHVQHRVHYWDGSVEDFHPPMQTRVYPAQQPSRAVAELDGEPNWGPTTRGPLGWIVHARSGDKGSNANVGFWVRFADEWPWLKWLLSTLTMENLLGDEYKGGRIDRCEFRNAYAVHFLLHDHLDRGVSSTSTRDFLAKNVAEFLRARHVDLPVKFLNRGKL